MWTATSETESKSRDLSISVHHYTLRAPCPRGQGEHGPPTVPVVRSCRGKERCAGLEWKLQERSEL